MPSKRTRDRMLCHMPTQHCANINAQPLHSKAQNPSVFTQLIPSSVPGNPGSQAALLPGRGLVSSAPQPWVGSRSHGNQKCDRLEPVLHDLSPDPVCSLRYLSCAAIS